MVEGDDHSDCGELIDVSRIIMIVKCEKGDVIHLEPGNRKTS
jgi:hypothetical protein